jgi:hypothetical protein
MTAGTRRTARGVEEDNPSLRTPISSQPALPRREPVRPHQVECRHAPSRAWCAARRPGTARGESPTANLQPASPGQQLPARLPASVSLHCRFLQDEGRRSKNPGPGPSPTGSDDDRDPRAAHQGSPLAPNTERPATRPKHRASTGMPAQSLSVPATHRTGCHIVSWNPSSRYAPLHSPSRLRPSPPRRRLPRRSPSPCRAPVSESARRCDHAPAPQPQPSR